MVRYFKNLHKGQTAYIACTGPSLAGVELPDNAIVFGMNRGYLHPTLRYRYFLVADKVVATQYANELNQVRCTAMFTSEGIARENILSPPLWTWRGGAKPGFYTDFTGEIYGGGTVTFIALQLAYHMGFSTVKLIGLDHNWQHRGTRRVGGMYEVVMVERDHFVPDYFGAADKYYKPQIKKSEEAYAMAAEAYREAGRTLLNCTPNSALPSSIIERVPII